MNHFLKISALFLSLCAACGLALAAEKAAPAKPAAPKAAASQETGIAVTVNGAPITEADIDAKIKPQIDKMSSMMAPNYLEQYRKRMRTQALEGMIIEKLMDEKIKQVGIAVTDKDADDKLKEIAAQQGTTVEKIQSMIKGQGQDFDQVKEQIKKGLKYEKFMDTQWAGKIDVNEADAKQYYEQNKEQFQTPEQVKASHILIKAAPTASDEDKAKAKAKAEQLLKQAKAGEDFAKLAKENSEGPSNTKGGDLGFFKKGQMVKPFEDAAFALQPGQLSDVVQTQFGYHIIKVTGRKEAGNTSFEDAKEQMMKMLKQKKQGEFYKKYISTLEAGADIVYPPKKQLAAEQVSGEDKTSQSPGQNASGPSSELKYKKIDDDTILITEGFPYDKELKMSSLFTAKVLDAPTLDKLSFDKVLVQESVDETGNFDAVAVNAACNINWEFAKAGIKFRVGNHIYTSLKSGATIKFTDDGVLLNGFDISPDSEVP